MNRLRAAAACALLLGCEMSFDARQACVRDADCPASASCVQGSCTPCPACASGEVCLAAQCFPAACGDRPCPAGQGCIGEVCADARCAGVTCAPDGVCVSGDCYPRDCAGEPCAPASVCAAGACTPTACIGAACAAGEICANGGCYPADCLDADCGAAAACVGDRCQPVDCMGLTCPQGTACAGGVCVPEDCVGVPCPQGFACLSGFCGDPACSNVECAAGTYCENAECRACRVAEARCGDSRDEDCDGLRDCADPDCLDQECAPPTACAASACDAAGQCRATAAAAGVECRAAVSDCDLAERCDGTSPDCPVDRPALAGAICRTRAGPCDAEESCDGSSPQCPADLVASACTPAVLAISNGAAHDFGALEPGRSAPWSFTFTNQGGWDATLGPVDDASLGLAAPFARTGGSCASGAAVVPGGSCTLEVTFSPGGLASFSSAFGLAYHDGSASQTTAGSVQGVGALPGSVTLTSPSPVHNRLDAASFSGTCTAGQLIDVTGADTSTASCPSGTWSYTTAARTTDASRGYTFTQGSSSVTGTWVRDTTPPVLTATAINGGATYATTPILQVLVAATDASPPLEQRVAEANLSSWDCQGQYADEGWQPLGTSTITIAPADGPRKVCAWVKDALGNVSVISPPAGTLGVDADEIEYQAGNIPRVTAFSVTNGTAGANFGTRDYAAGDAVNVQWTVTDVEGLANDPISLFLTLDGKSWTPLVQRFGALAGNPTNWSGSYASFLAPAGFFRIKIVAWDQAGNSSLSVVSDSQNTPSWSVWAGSTDPGVGGTSRSVSLMSWDNNSYRFDVDPLTGDLYYEQWGMGLLKIDAATGLVSLFMAQGDAATANLPAFGDPPNPTGGLYALPANPVYEGLARVRFDSDGLLYLRTGGFCLGCPLRIHQVDLRARTVRPYLGKGGVIDPASATPATVFVHEGPFAFDESHRLYFPSFCSTQQGWQQGVSTLRLLRVTQNGDKTPGVIEPVAGNCVRGLPPRPGPGDALTSPLTSTDAADVGSLEVWNDGAAIFYGFHAMGPAQKILDGRSYVSNIPDTDAGLFRDRATGKLYAASGAIYEIAPNLAGANGDGVQVWASGAGTAPGCNLDGVDAAQACVNANYTLTATRQGTLLFSEGQTGAGQREDRIRFKDAQNRLRTAAGVLPFHEAGLHRSVVRSRFAGIHFHDGAAGFPAGLYFLDRNAPLFGVIDPATGIAQVLWGNQRLEQRVHQTGTPITADLSLGPVYYGDAKALAFDSAGLPWVKYAGALARVDASRNVVALQPGGGTPWELAADGSDPALAHSWPYGLMSNLTLRGQGAFYLGGYDGYASYSTIKLLDFGTSRVTRLMGRAPDAFSPDNATPGSVQGLSIAAGCKWNDACFAQYRAADGIDPERLYFTEQESDGRERLRYINDPANPASSTLGTVFLASSVRNFVFSRDGSQIFYLDASGYLRCHTYRNPAKAWCNDSVLGPPAGLTPIELSLAPNSMTWLSDTELLLSTGKGEIYRYQLPP